MIIEVTKKVSGWYWRIKAKGRILCHSEQYASKANATRAAKRYINSAYKLKMVIKNV